MIKCGDDLRASAERRYGEQNPTGKEGINGGAQSEVNRRKSEVGEASKRVGRRGGSRRPEVEDEGGEGVRARPDLCSTTWRKTELRQFSQTRWMERGPGGHAGEARRRRSALG